MARQAPKSPRLLRRSEFGSMEEYLEHVDRFTEYQEMKEAMDKVKRSLTTKYNAEKETVEDKTEEKAKELDDDEEGGEVKHARKIRKLDIESSPEDSSKVEEAAPVSLPSGTIKGIKERCQTFLETSSFSPLFPSSSSFLLLSP